MCIRDRKMAASAAAETFGFNENLGPRPKSPADGLSSTDTGRESLRTKIKCFCFMRNVMYKWYIIYYRNESRSTWAMLRYVAGDNWEMQHLLKNVFCKMCVDSEEPLFSSTLLLPFVISMTSNPQKAIFILHDLSLIHISWEISFQPFGWTGLAFR